MIYLLTLLAKIQKFLGELRARKSSYFIRRDGPVGHEIW